MKKMDERTKGLLKALDNVECSKCGYDWKPRVEKPKACPRCKTRFDYPGDKDGKL